MKKLIKRLLGVKQSKAPLSDYKLSKILEYSFKPIHYNWHYLTMKEKQILDNSDMVSIQNFVDKTLK